MIKFWQKKVTVWEKKIVISGKPAVILGTAITVLMGAFLLYCAVNPPEFFSFLKDNLNRMIYGVIGTLLIIKTLKIFFTKKNKS